MTEDDHRDYMMAAGLIDALGKRFHEQLETAIAKCPTTEDETLNLRLKGYVLALMIGMEPDEPVTVGVGTLVSLLSEVYRNRALARMVHESADKT